MPSAAMLLEPFSADVPAKNVTAHTGYSTAPAVRLSDAISQQLGVDIVRGLYSVGDTLPTEMALAGQWHVSRTAIREGIRILTSKGMVEARKKSGTIVRERSRWQLLDPVVMSWMRHAEPGETFVRSLVELQLIIEPQATALAARRRSDDDLATLRGALAVMSDPNRNDEAARRAEIQFHRAIMHAARNETFVPLTTSIEAAVAWSTAYKIRGGTYVRSAVHEYERILDAIVREDDAEARWWMEVLIRPAVDLVAGKTRPKRD